MAQGTVTVSIVGDASKLKSALGESESALGRFSGKMQDVGTSIMGIGSRLTLGITAPLAFLGKKVFDAASDLNESMSKVDTVFGESAAGIQSWATTTAKAMGISRQGALEAAGTFGNLFTAMGMGKAPAATMSKDLVGLAADLASFNNLDPTEVLEKLRSGLVGEVEPLRSLGVAFLAADVERKAFELGLQSADGSLSESAKIQARYALIMEQTTTAQGDFARTADGAANKQRIATAQFKDAAATLGQQLLPIGQKLIGWVTQLVEKFNALSPTQQKMILLGAALAAALGPLVTIIGALVTVVGLLISPVGLVIIGIAALVAGVIYAYNHFETFRETVDNVLATVRTSIEAFIAVVTAAWQLWGDDILRIVQGVWTTIYGVVSGALQAISGIIAVVTGIIHGDWAMVWDGIKQIFQGAWDAIVGILSGFVQTILGMFGGMFDGLRAVAVEMLGYLSGLPGAILGALSDIPGLLFDVGKQLIGGFINGIKSMFGSVKDALGDLTLSLTDWKGPLDLDKRILYGSGQAVIDGFRRGLESSYGGVRSSLGGFTGSLSGDVGLRGSMTGTARSGSGRMGDIIIVQVDGREIARAVRNHDRGLQ